MKEIESYTLIKEGRGYIFKDEGGFGYDGHHFTADEAIDGFLNCDENTVLITRK